MRIKNMALISFLLMALIALNCSHEQKAPLQNDNEQKPITITDRTGKVWDITHAVEQYNLEPRKFNYGLGPDAIQPINFPQMLSEGDPGYPSDESTRPIIGVEINGEARAYPVEILAHHEVVNERVAGANITVNY